MLTVKQKSLCEFFAESGNLAESAKKAGYAKPAQSGSEEMAKKHVREYYNSITAHISSERIMNATERQETLTAIARDKKQKTTDRIKAIDQLSRIQGDYLERHQIESVIMPSVIELISG